MCVYVRVSLCVCVYCMHAHALQLLTDKIKGKSNRLIAPVCLPSVSPLSLSFTPPPLRVPTLNAATVNEIVSSRFVSFAPTRLIVARLVSSAVVHWRNSWWSDFMASNANCAHAPPSLFLLLLLFFLPPSLSLSHSPTLPASALSAAATCVRILLQRFVWFFSSLASSVFAKRKSQKVYATSRATKQSQKRQVSLASLFPLLPLVRSFPSTISLSLSPPTCSCFHLCCQLILFRVKSSFFFIVQYRT